MNRPETERRRPQIMGIVNITSDSFSDGGRYLEPDAAVAHAGRLLSDGAHILDLGPASSNPKAGHVGAEEEIRRLTPVVAALKSSGAAISIDSCEPETQDWALGEGVAYLNDIKGFPDPDFYPRLADSDVRLIVMHSLQAAEKADNRPPPEGDIIAHICGFFEKRVGALLKAGIDEERLILDPGMGFFLGNRPETSFRVLAGLGEIKGRFGLPLLVSVSRKSFLRAATGRPVEEAGPATLAAEIAAVLNGADILRTHEPAPLADALTVLTALKEVGTIR